MPRNHAKDFFKAPHATIRTSELAEYASWLALNGEAKKALHSALVQKLGATLERRQFCRNGKIFSELAYLGVFWNLDSGFHDFEQFALFSKEITSIVLRAEGKLYA